MEKNKLLIRLVVLMLFIFALHKLAHKLFWFSSIWWFDMPMHFLGGLWVGFFFIYVFCRKNPAFRASFYIIALTFLMGVSWEVFEFWTNNYIARHPFSPLDTFSDILFNTAGSLFAIYWFTRDTFKSPQIKYN